MAVETIAPGIEQIAQLYEFREADEVGVFLKHNPFALEILERTRPEITRVFGEHAIGVYLQRHYDIEDREESLWIKIRVDLNVDEARQYLRRFDEEWRMTFRRPFFGTIEADIEFAPRVRS